MPAKKSRFSASDKNAEAMHAVGERIIGNELPEIRHLRAGQDHIENGEALPEDARPWQQIDGALFDAIVRQMANDDGVFGNSPICPRTSLVAAITAVDIDAQALPNNSLRRDTQIANRFLFAGRLNEDAVRRAKQPAKRWGRVLPACAIVGIARIAQVKERRDEKRHVQSPSEAKTADDWPGVRKRSGVDQIVLFVRSAGGTPHGQRNGIARQGQALPQTLRHQREWFEQPAPAAPPDRSADSDGCERRCHPRRRRASNGRSRTKTTPDPMHSWSRPSRRRRDRRNNDEPAEVRLRTPEGRRISLYEVGHSHGRSFAGKPLEGRRPAGMIAIRTIDATEEMWESRCYHFPNWHRASNRRPTLAAGAKARQLGLPASKFSISAWVNRINRRRNMSAKHAADAMRAGHTHYTPVAGVPELRQAIARWYDRFHGFKVSPDQVVVSNGAKHSLHNALVTTCGVGDEVVIPTPYWVSYSDLVSMAGATPVLVHATFESGFKLSPEQLRAALTRRTKLVMLNSPCNPTGTVYTRRELEQLVDVILETPAGIFSDEIYEQLCYGDAKPTCIATLRADLAGRTITISGASKSYAMTGWRMGWAVAPIATAKAMADIQSQETSCPSSVSQYATIAAWMGRRIVWLGCCGNMRRGENWCFRGCGPFPDCGSMFPMGLFTPSLMCPIISANRLVEKRFATPSNSVRRAWNPPTSIWCPGPHSVAKGLPACHTPRTVSRLPAAWTDWRRGCPVDCRNGVRPWPSCCSPKMTFADF